MLLRNKASVGVGCSTTNSGAARSLSVLPRPQPCISRLLSSHRRTAGRGLTRTLAMEGVHACTRAWFWVTGGNCFRSQAQPRAAGSLHAVLEAPSQIPGLAADGPVAQESAASSSKAINWYQQWWVGRKTRPHTNIAWLVGGAFVAPRLHTLWLTAQQYTSWLTHKLPAGAADAAYAPACRYPLAIVKDLDPQRPTAASLLGIPVVIWQDGKGAWNCFDDRCPHRCVCVFMCVCC